MTSWSSSIKIGFYKLIVCFIKKMSWCETEMQKYMLLVKQNVMKFEVFILRGQRIDQKRNKGWWRGSRERIEMEVVSRAPDSLRESLVHYSRAVRSGLE